MSNYNAFALMTYRDLRFLPTEVLDGNVKVYQVFDRTADDVVAEFKSSLAAERECERWEAEPFKSPAGPFRND
jgi:hypothetical protein